MMRQADLDRDGFISCQEFYEAITYKPLLLWFIALT